MRRGGILAGLLQLGNFFGGAIAAGLGGLGLGNRVAALGIERGKILQHLGRIRAAQAQLGLDERADFRGQNSDQA